MPAGFGDADAVKAALVDADFPATKSGPYTRMMVPDRPLNGSGPGALDLGRSSFSISVTR